jgi:hypothetical protein
MGCNTTVEISIKGKWFTVPALTVGGQNILVRGKWIRVAALHDELWQEHALADPEACIRRLKMREPGGLDADILTFAERVPDTTPRYSYPFELESIAAIPLMTFATWWDGLPQETRKNARRAAKRGVITSVRPLDSKLINDIVGVNNDAAVKQGRKFSHYGKSPEQVEKDQSTWAGRSDFICAYAGEELIGFMKIVYCGHVATILQLITKSSHYDKKPANALIAKAVERCVEKQVSHFVYGKFRYGNQIQTSLMEFKTRHGFREYLVPRYYVPLTIKGRVAAALNLHHDLVGILPPRALVLGGRLREKWYKLGLSSRPA